MRRAQWSLILYTTFDGLEDDARVVIGDDVGVAVFGLVHLQVGMFPRELLPGVDGLWRQEGEVCGVGWPL